MYPSTEISRAHTYSGGVRLTFSAEIRTAILNVKININILNPHFIYEETPLNLLYLSINFALVYKLNYAQSYERATTV